MKSKQKIKVLVFLLIALILYFGYYIIHAYSKYKFYMSNEVVGSLNTWVFLLNPYFNKFMQAPNTVDFFNYLESDSGVQNDFANLIPKGLGKNDFAITFDSLTSVSSIWLFGIQELKQDTLLYNQMKFLDFLLKRNVLVGYSSICHCCDREFLRILKNGTPTADEYLTTEIEKILFEIRYSDFFSSTSMDEIDCCFHIYHRNGLHIESFYSGGECANLLESYKDSIIDRFDDSMIDSVGYE